MSTFALKIFAIFVMLVDHIGAIFFPYQTYPQLNLVLRGIGRLAFPIFIFLIVEGFYHTSDIRKYLKRLGCFALISEIPFDLAFYNYHNHTNIGTDISKMFSSGFHPNQLNLLLGNLIGAQNVFFTLFLGLFLIYLMSLVDKKFKNEVLLTNVLDAVLTIGFCIAAYFLKCDYDYAGILLMVAFYLFRGSNILISICIFFISGAILCGFNNMYYFVETGNFIYIVSIFATFAIIPIALYNGKKGKNVKYLFYVFYPAHLLILFLISCFILK